MKLNLKTKLAAWLVKCAEHLDPHSKLYSPFSNVVDPIQISSQSHTIERMCVQINYSHKFLDCATEQFESDYVLPEIANKIAKELLKQGYIKVERFDNSHDRQWNAQLYVAKM